MLKTFFPLLAQDKSQLNTVELFKFVGDNYNFCG